MTSHDAPDAPETVLKSPPTPARLVFFDATDLHWCPDVGYSDVPQAQQRRVQSPGVDNPWYALFGSLEYPSGEGLYTIHQRKRHQEVRAHLERLLDRDPEAFWIVVLDNASAHTTPKLDEFPAQHQERLTLVFQPTYSPHLNLIERLWRLMRDTRKRERSFHLSPHVSPGGSWYIFLTFPAYGMILK